MTITSQWIGKPDTCEGMAVFGEVSVPFSNFRDYFTIAKLLQQAEEDAYKRGQRSVLAHAKHFVEGGN